MKDTQTDPRLEFANLMETISRADGLSPHGGRIIGYLMLSTEPVPFSELAEALEMSRGSVSENAKVLVSHGVIERLRFPGDRRDHFRLCDGGQQAIFERAQQRDLEALDTISKFTSRRTLGALERQRIAGMKAFLRARIEFGQGLLSRMTETQRHLQQ